MLHRIGDKNTESDGSLAGLHDPGLKRLPAFPRRQAGRFKITKKKRTIFFF